MGREPANATQWIQPQCHIAHSAWYGRGMRQAFVEFSNGFNWGKFLVQQFEPADYAYRSEVDHRALLQSQGWWGRPYFLITDLATGEGFVFYASQDDKATEPHVTMALRKHQIWTCPMFPLFLAWFNEHREHHEDIGTLPPLIEDASEQALSRSSFIGSRGFGPYGCAIERLLDEHGSATITRVGIEYVVSETPSLVENLRRDLDLQVAENDALRQRLEQLSAKVVEMEDTLPTSNTADRLPHQMLTKRSLTR